MPHHAISVIITTLVLKYNILLVETLLKWSKRTTYWIVFRWLYARQLMCHIRHFGSRRPRRSL